MRGRVVVVVVVFLASLTLVPLAGALTPAGTVPGSGRRRGR